MAVPRHMREGPGASDPLLALSTGRSKRHHGIGLLNASATRSASSSSSSSSSPLDSQPVPGGRAAAAPSPREQDALVEGSRSPDHRRMGTTTIQNEEAHPLPTLSASPAGVRLATRLEPERHA